jgi:hypothetical protein
VLLPKDYVRLQMTGDKASDLSDAAGTLWVDVAERRWSETMLAATGLSVEPMPHLYEGTQDTGMLRPAVAELWSMPVVPVVAGAVTTRLVLSASARPESDNELAYRFYDRNQGVLGKTMEEHLRFAVCMWHTFCWPGCDVFGAGTFERPLAVAPAGDRSRGDEARNRLAR